MLTSLEIRLGSSYLLSQLILQSGLVSYFEEFSLMLAGIYQEEGGITLISDNNKWKVQLSLSQSSRVRKVRNERHKSHQEIWEGLLTNIVTTTRLDLCHLPPVCPSLDFFGSTVQILVITVISKIIFNTTLEWYHERISLYKYVESLGSPQSKTNDVNDSYWNICILLLIPDL